MSNERSEPYNLRRRRVTAPSSPSVSEGFITASEALRRAEELGISGGGATTESEQEEPTPTQELVLDVPAHSSNEGTGSGEAPRTPQIAANRDQGDNDSSGEAQGQRSAPAHSSVVTEDTSNNGQEVLRLRVRVSDKYLDYLLAMY